MRLLAKPIQLEVRPVTLESDGLPNDITPNLNPELKAFDKPAFESAVLMLIEKLLNTEDIALHAKATYGGGKKKESVKSLIYRVANFLCWSHLSIKQSHLDSADWTKWVTSLMATHYPVLAKYCASLEHEVLLMPSTILTYLSDMKYFMKWFSIFRTVGIEAGNAFNFNAMACAVAKGYNKLRKNLTLRHRSLETAIEDRKLPAGGLEELQAIVRTTAPQSIAAVEPDMLTPTTYRHYMELLLAAIYVFSAQGRFAAVSTLTNAQAQEMLDQGKVMSTDFKTNHTYGYQPVTLHAFSRMLLTIYVDKVRPQVALTLPTPKECLWLSHNGVPVPSNGVRHAVTRFFRRSPLGFGVTTTAIRTLVETKVEKLYRQGAVSYDQRVAISNISGHNSATVRLHYLMQDRLEDTRLASEVFSVIMNDTMHDTPYLDFSNASEPADTTTPPPLQSDTCIVDRTNSHSRFKLINHLLLMLHETILSFQQRQRSM